MNDDLVATIQLVIPETVVQVQVEHPLLDGVAGIGAGVGTEQRHVDTFEDQGQVQGRRRQQGLGGTLQGHRGVAVHRALDIHFGRRVRLAAEAVDISVDIAYDRAKADGQRLVHEVDFAVGNVDPGHADRPGRLLLGGAGPGLLHVGCAAVGLLSGLGRQLRLPGVLGVDGAILVDVNAAGVVIDGELLQPDAALLEVDGQFVPAHRLPGSERFFRPLQLTGKCRDGAAGLDLRRCEPGQADIPRQPKLAAGNFRLQGGGQIGVEPGQRQGLQFVVQLAATRSQVQGAVHAGRGLTIDGQGQAEFAVAGQGPVEGGGGSGDGQHLQPGRVGELGAPVQFAVGDLQALELCGPARIVRRFLRGGVRAVAGG